MGTSILREDMPSDSSPGMPRSARYRVVSRGVRDDSPWVRDVAKHLKLSGRRVTLIEVTTAEPRR